MHQLIDGKKENLAVRIYKIEETEYVYKFFDKYEEYDGWVNDQIAKGFWKIEKTENFKDVNYLLNRMIKEKSTRYGEILFEIYIKHYPDSDQKVNVWKLWHGFEIKKGEKYIEQRRPWYTIEKSFISSLLYTVMIKCKKCKTEKEAEVTSIPGECAWCENK